MVSGMQSSCKEDEVPLSQRLRSQKGDSEKPAEPPLSKVKVTKKMAVSKATLDQLFETMRESQTKSEQTLMKAIEASKLEINENMNNMVATLAKNIGSIREDLTKVEKSFDTKIEGIKSELSGITGDLKNTKERVGAIDTTLRENKKTLLSRVGNVEKDFATAQKSHRVEHESIRREIRENATKQNEEIAKQMELLEKIKESLERRMENMSLEIGGNTADIKQMTGHVESLDNKSRQRNIIIDGIPEEKDDAGTKTKVLEYIQKVLPKFESKNIVSCYRVGKLRKPRAKKIVYQRDLNKTLPQDETQQKVEATDVGEIRQTQEKQEEGPKPRLVVIGLRSAEARDLILSRAADIRANTGLKGFWINRDQNESSRRKHQLVKACYNLLVQNKYKCSIKGSTIMP